jgi:hypothetical protein
MQLLACPCVSAVGLDPKRWLPRTALTHIRQGQRGLRPGRTPHQHGPIHHSPAKADASACGALAGPLRWGVGSRCSSPSSHGLRSSQLLHPPRHGPGASGFQPGRLGLPPSPALRAAWSGPPQGLNHTRRRDIVCAALRFPELGGPLPPRRLRGPIRSASHGFSVTQSPTG